MPGAVFRVHGEFFDPDRLLPTLSLRPYMVYRRGEPMATAGSRREKRYDSGGFRCDVSQSDGLLSEQAEDALVFLREHHADLEIVRDFPGVEDLRIDFGYNLRLNGHSIAVQRDYLSPALLRIAGELGVGFELSLYPEFEPNESVGS